MRKNEATVCVLPRGVKFSAAACLAIAFSGCIPNPGTVHLARYANDIEFRGRDTFQGAWMDHVQWYREIPNTEFPITIVVDGRRFDHDDLQFNAFQAAGATVPVSKHEEKFGGRWVPRNEPMLGYLELSGGHFRLWCKYDAQAQLELVDLYVFDEGGLPEGTTAFKIDWDGTNVGFPCKYKDLKRRIGEPQTYEIFNMGM
jgi:hypothetical protein